MAHPTSPTPSLSLRSSREAEEALVVLDYGSNGFRDFSYDELYHHGFIQKTITFPTKNLKKNKFQA